MALGLQEPEQCLARSLCLLQAVNETVSKTAQGPGTVKFKLPIGSAPGMLSLV